MTVRSLKYQVLALPKALHSKILVSSPQHESNHERNSYQHLLPAAMNLICALLTESYPISTDLSVGIDQIVTFLSVLNHSLMHLCLSVGPYTHPRSPPRPPTTLRWSVEGIWTPKHYNLDDNSLGKQQVMQVKRYISLIYWQCKLNLSSKCKKV